MRKASRALEVPRLLRRAHQTQRVFGAEVAWIVSFCFQAHLRREGTSLGLRLAAVGQGGGGAEIRVKAGLLAEISIEALFHFLVKMACKLRLFRGLPHLIEGAATQEEKLIFL